MAPLSPDNTQRWYYTYQQGEVSHELVLRGNSAGTLIAADAVVAGILTGVGAHFIASTITGVEHSAAGSNLRFPVDSDRVGDVFGSGTPTAYHKATYMGWVGRSEGGRRARLFLFGYKDALLNYRILASADSGVDDSIGVLNTADTVGVGIDAQNVIWHNYVNLGVNDHWEGKARTG